MMIVNVPAEKINLAALFFFNFTEMVKYLKKSDIVIYEIENLKEEFVVFSNVFVCLVCFFTFHTHDVGLLRLH